MVLLRCGLHPNVSPDMHFALYVALITALIPGLLALDCFKCVSLDGRNPACDEPFHNNYTTDVLEQPCMGGRKGRNGVFPATSCVKLSGVFEDGHRMVVRGCALDSGGLTIDTELVRMSHCGGFYFEGKYVSGCVQSCTEDACNAARRLDGGAIFVMGIWTVLIVLMCISGG